MKMSGRSHSNEESDGQLLISDTRSGRGKFVYSVGRLFRHENGFRRYFSRRGVPRRTFPTNGMRARSHNSFLCNVDRRLLVIDPCLEKHDPVRRGAQRLSDYAYFSASGTSTHRETRKEILAPKLTARNVQLLSDLPANRITNSVSRRENRISR